MQLQSGNIMYVISEFYKYTSRRFYVGNKSEHNDDAH